MFDLTASPASTSDPFPIGGRIKCCGSVELPAYRGQFIGTTRHFQRSGRALPTDAPSYTPPDVFYRMTHLAYVEARSGDGGLP